MKNLKKDIWALIHIENPDFCYDYNEGKSYDFSKMDGPYLTTYRHAKTLEKNHSILKIKAVKYLTPSAK